MRLSLHVMLLILPASVLQGQASTRLRSAVGAQHLADTTVRLDPGIGIVSPLGSAARDSLPLYLTSADSAVWGWFVRDLSGRDSLPFALVAPVSLRPNIVEFTYEESALPVDSIARDKTTARVLLGWDGAGVMRRVWVRLDSTVILRRWAEVLAQYPLFFRPGLGPQFFAAPQGAAFPVILTGGDDPDYAMHPKRVAGSWMEVEVVTPSDYCAEDTARRRRETVWIRFLDPRGRPRVWYYTRGC